MLLVGGAGVLVRWPMGFLASLAAVRRVRASSTMEGTRLRALNRRAVAFHDGQCLEV